MDRSVIERLARLKGIGDAYHDYRGELKHFSFETKCELLSAMGVPVDDPDALSNELRRAEVERACRMLPLVAAVCGGSRIGVDVSVSARDFGSTLIWSVISEDGSRQEGAASSADFPEVWRGEVDGSWYTRRRMEVPLDLSPGYYWLEARLSTGAPSRCRLIVAPAQCFEPAAIVAGGRLWGLAVQLYTLRSRGNWGIGDFADLKTLIRWLAPYGAGFIGLNPLHALAPSDPQRASPYSA